MSRYRALGLLLCLLALVGAAAAERLFDPELGLIMKADMSGAAAATYTSGRSETITYHNSVKLNDYNGQKLTAD